MRPKIFSLLLIASFLALGLWSAAKFVETSPAYKSELRVETVFGDQRVTPSRHMYHRADYLFHVAQDFLAADLTVSQATGSENVLIDDTQLEVWARNAQLRSQQALEFSPTNAHYWTAFAWSSALLDEIDLARDAMVQSRKFAPFNLQLAYDRLVFSGLIAEEFQNTNEQLTLTEQKASLDDFRTIEHFDARTAQDILQQEELFELISGSAAPQ